MLCLSKGWSRAMFEAPKLVDDLDVSLAHYAVFGHPVAHSKSPVIHRAFAHQCGIALRYDAIDVAPGTLAQALSRFSGSGGVGANITLPLKAEAFAIARVHSERARRLGVANTVAWRGDHWIADYTGGEGLSRDTGERPRLDLRGRRVLLVGAGGAAQGVLPALLDAGVARITIANRNPERADKLSDWIGDPARVQTWYLDDLRRAGDFDAVFNATSAGQHDAALDLPFTIANARTLAYDLSYGRAASAFLAWAKAAGCAYALDGLGMLVEQAAAAFEIWHGTRPETDPVFAALRRDLAT